MLYDFKVCKISTKAWAKLPLQPLSNVVQNVIDAFVWAKKLQWCTIRHYPSWSEAIKKIIYGAYTRQTPSHVQNLSSGQRFISSPFQTKFVNVVSEVA